MQMKAERKVPLNISLTLATHDVISHSALVDLTAEQKSDIQFHLNIFLNDVEIAMNIRRRELGKDRG
jgi:hypothetical protein